MMHPDLMKRFDLTGRSALVTGGAQGIGLEIARTLRMAGASLTLADLDLDTARKAAAGVGPDVDAFHCDVADPQSVRDLAASIGPCPDILVNNAGVPGKTRDTSDDDWRFVISVNLDGVFNCCSTIGTAMAERGSGNIVNIGSICGSIVAKLQSDPAYNASKAGVHMLTKSYACKWAKSGVRVNAVAPGYVATKMTNDSNDNISTWAELTPIGRLGRTEEIANAVQFLASDASSYVTGTVLPVDGGYTIW
ncbi:SDR family NAD(P)-dependent oxidoreductase [Mesorhizobium humile]|uniref:SDR family oxidoreductase n=1 Tax=Mesorhizobium humile TaxID=3072313 RepID=A0ABU4YN38_9HYPH|nr:MULTISPECIES: SDR family oxidoreductase [unclassified Mesorhizobium]MDX8463257.1 SDR family oxidoreductase [Mesorhizobium sp. VK2D]MDX8488399.1 SDR family oxidoreductase [Mesorhizobium sp. VK2B]